MSIPLTNGSPLSIEQPQTSPGKGFITDRSTSSGRLTGDGIPSSEAEKISTPTPSAARRSSMFSSGELKSAAICPSESVTISPTAVPQVRSCSK